MDAEFLLVLCTCPDDGTAAAVSTALVEERLAACVNRLPGVRSRYRWRGQVETDDEVLLLIKTRGALYRELETTIQRLHPHENPEIIAVDIAGGAAAYLDWIRDSVK
jgi:periplasmic divalent cation tolerance protein